ncbi:MAG: hypothetical protein LBC87_09495 [Fibromonadaceae bacterium]|nr:hypothetical protein [Fibromonadaceae bacterium]
MKKFLSISCFLFLQAISCSMGTIEANPEATKFTIQNNSKVQLFCVKWNGTDFGHIGIGDFSEKVVLNDGKGGPVDFDISNDEPCSSKSQYRTHRYFSNNKHKHNKECIFINNTLVINNVTNVLDTLGGILNVD